MDAIFRLEGGNVIFNEGIVSELPIIKKIIRRDRGGVIEGDSEGRNKLLAKKELLYVWNIVNVNAPGIRAGRTGKELEDYAKALVELPESWKPDDVLKEFIEFYSNYHDAAVVKTIKQLLAGFDIINSSNDLLIQIIKNELKNPKLTTDSIGELIKAQKEILNNSASIPKLVDQLKTAAEEYNLIEESLGIQRGGKPVRKSMVVKH
jgi:hypothetical protein